MPEKDHTAYPWFVKPGNIAIIIAAFLLFLSFTTFFLCYRHYEHTKEHILKEDQKTAYLVSLLLDSYLQKIVKTMESYASRPLLIQAVKEKNPQKTMRHLISFAEGSEDIDILVVTDSHGTVLIAYPERLEIIGKNFAYRDWYKGISRDWKPYISDISMRVVAEKDTAIWVVVPIFDEKERVIGILVNTQRTIGIKKVIGQVPIEPGVSISVCDNKGQIVYSSRYPFENEIRIYPYYTAADKIKESQSLYVEAEDVMIAGNKRYLTFSPMAIKGWNIFIGRDKKNILLSDWIYYVQTSSISLLIFIMIIFSLLYFRKRVVMQQFMERMRAEEALRESENRLKLTLDATNEGIWDWNLPTGKAVFSPHYYTMLGYEPYEFSQDYGSWRSLVHPDDVEKTEKYIQKHIAEGKNYSVEFRMKTKSGEWKWILGRGSVVERDDEGKPLRMVGTHTDIDNLKHTETEIIKTRDYLNNLIDYANAPIIVWDPEFRITRFNHAFEKLTGRPANEVLGQKIDILFPEEKKDECMDYIYKATKGERWEVIEIPIIHKHGSVFIVLWNSATIYELDGKTPVSTIAQGQDITERKQIEKTLRESERRWMEIFNRTSNAIAIYDAVDNGEDFIFKDFNPAGERIEQISRSDLVGRRVTDVFPGVKDFGIFYAFQRVWRTGNPEHFCVSFYKDERISGWRDNYIFKLDTGEVVAVYEDVTAKKQAEAEIRRLNIELEQRVRERTAQLEATNKELEAFAYSVSHDLRAPLRGISGFSQILLEEYYTKLDQKGRDYIKRISAGSQRMAELIDDLLKLSRVTRAELRYEKVNLSNLAHSIKDGLLKSNPERNVVFEIDENIIVKGDPQLMIIALENLLNNAFKFTRHNPDAKIEFGTTTHEGRKVCYIKDNGVGFEMEYADKLFVAFQRLHSGDEFEGTGVGLATVQRIINKHGGRIWAEAELGKGAVFYFEI